MRLSGLFIGWFFATFAFSAFNADAAPDKPMSFSIVVSGGNCSTCSWIEANGVIEQDTAEKFARFFETHFPARPAGGRIHLNSPGGSLLGGIKLGALIRNLKANTAVSASVVQDVYKDGTVLAGDSVDDAECSSACVFAFLGGVSRFASKQTSGADIGFRTLGRLGVHQFYDPVSLDDMEALNFSALDRIADQKIVSMLLSYLTEMGISAQLLQLAAATEPTSIHYLTEEELRLTKADNGSSSEVAIVAYPNGVGVTQVSTERQDASYRVELYCHQSALRMLATITWRGWYDVDGHKEWAFLKGVSTDGVQLKLLSEKFESSSTGETIGSFLFAFEGAAMTDLVKRKAFSFEDWSSRHANDAASQLSFTVPNDFHGLSLLPRTCLTEQ